MHENSLNTLLPFASTGKYHVEQDPQYALVHLQFVHWADKLLKVIVTILLLLIFGLCVCCCRFGFAPAGDDLEFQDSWYRTLERVMFPSKPAAEIVKRYEVL